MYFGVLKALYYSDASSKPFLKRCNTGEDGAIA